MASGGCEAAWGFTAAQVMARMVQVRAAAVLNDVDMTGALSARATHTPKLRPMPEAPALPQARTLGPSPWLSPAINRLWLPRLSLTACVRGVMSRSTLGLDLPDTRRFNYFPASPRCSLSWWFAGCSQSLPVGAHAGQTADISLRHTHPGQVVFGGAHTGPSLSWNPGPAHGMMVMLMPDALHLMTGIEPQQWLNRLVDARQVLPASWWPMFDAVQHAPDDDARVALLESFLDPLWQAARPAQMVPGPRYHDWAEGLALRAATSSTGRSLRQVERRIRQWAGQPLRELRGVSRGERAFFEALAANEAGSLRLSDVALASGYTDQSHLSRETRRMTGFAPQQLQRQIIEEEGFWAYRIWR